MTIGMVARVPLEYDGERVAAGEVFVASPVQAAVLRYRGHAAFLSASYVTPAPTATDAVETPAEDVPAIVAPVRRRRRKVDAEGDDTPRPRRTYRRRDLTAD